MAAPIVLDFPARSLVWVGDELVDWVGGGVRIRLDGSTHHPGLGSFDGCDAVVCTRDGQWAVVYERLGTNGVVLDRGCRVREIRRSRYHAEAYEYPVCVWRDANGRALLGHCPDEYCRIEIDDAATGERLTRAHTGGRSPQDFFHSRLQVNPSATRLLSAGWIWQPVDFVGWFDIAKALADARELDMPDRATHSSHVCIAEEGSGCWQSDDRVLLGGSGEPEDPGVAAEVADEDPRPRLHPNGIAVFDLRRRIYEPSFVLPEPPGTMMPVGDHHVVAFHGHPKLVDLRSGTITREWPELDSGHQTSSIMRGIERPSPLALDPGHRRFALAQGDRIHVTTLTDEDLALR